MIQRFKSQAVLLMGGFGMMIAAYLLGTKTDFVPAKSATEFWFFDMFEYVNILSSKDVAGLGLMIMACTGFAKYMDHIGASSRLVDFAIKPLLKMKAPYVVMVLAYFVNNFMSLPVPSASGLAMLMMVTLFPILVRLGVSRPAAAGVFDDIDVAFMMHGDDRTSTDNKNLAMNLVEFTFVGKSAHAAVAPEKGINALYGILSLFNGIGFLREHIRRDAKIHGIITEGGVAANIVPERATGRFYIRAEDRVYLNTLVERVYNVARGSAMATGTGTELTIREVKAYDNKVNTALLNSVLMEEAEKAGAVNIAPPRDSTGSSDFSCVTYRTPGTCLRSSFVPKGSRAIHGPGWTKAKALRPMPPSFSRPSPLQRLPCGLPATLISCDALPPTSLKRKKFLWINSNCFTRVACGAGGTVYPER